jgi:mono/diheme cytochrome c family protein
MKKKIIFTIFYIFIFNIFSSKNIKADDLFEKGKLIFLGDGNCATCHTLEDANSY